MFVRGGAKGKRGEGRDWFVSGQRTDLFVASDQTDDDHICENQAGESQHTHAHIHAVGAGRAGNNIPFSRP